MSADLARAIERYEALAPRYDACTRRIDAIRIRTIDALQLRPGQVVVDAGCGTGWCLPLLAARVGPRGRVLGFDPCDAMLAVAAGRDAVRQAGIDLIHAAAEEVRLPLRADAILFSYTHDLLRSPRALANVLGQARPGARVAATSTKLYAPWLFPANVYLRHTHRDYITDFDGFEAPWTLLAERLDDFHVETTGWTQHYVATGRVRASGQVA